MVTLSRSEGNGFFFFPPCGTLKGRVKGGLTGNYNGL